MFYNLLCLWIITHYLQEFFVSLRHYDVKSTHSVKKISIFVQSFW